MTGLEPVIYNCKEVPNCATARQLKWFFKWANLGLFLFIFGLFKQTIQLLKQINVKNVRISIQIQTHNLSNMSHHP